LALGRRAREAARPVRARDRRAEEEGAGRSDPGARLRDRHACAARRIRQPARRAPQHHRLRHGAGQSLLEHQEELIGFITRRVLASLTILLAVAVAIPLGVIAAWRFGGWLDRALMGLSVLGFSVPVFVLAYLLIWLVSLQLEWLPVQGYSRLSEGFLPFLRHLI